MPGTRTASISTVSALLALLIAVCLQVPAQGQTFSVLYNFTGGLDGANPYAGLLLDNAGNFYGTTTTGTRGPGTVFKFSNRNGSWTLTPLKNFQVGAFPETTLVVGKRGALFGTTSQGGLNNCGSYPGCGTIYAVVPSPNPPRNSNPPWTIATLYEFDGPDGGDPDTGGMIADADGNLYGTTFAGGHGIGLGVAYELSPGANGTWAYTVLHVFWGGVNDGDNPRGGVVFDSQGNLYGTTAYGGTTGWGTIFKLTHTPNGWTEEIVYNFQGGADGGQPWGGLVADAAGDLYGTTDMGGVGGGTIYELSPSNRGWAFNVLYTNPGFAWTIPGRLLLAADGNLYGAAPEGPVFGYGTIFKLTHSGGSWTYSDLHDFNDADGQSPFGTPVMDSAGNLYGTTVYGGNNVCQRQQYECGVIWKISPQ